MKLNNRYDFLQSTSKTSKFFFTVFKTYDVKNKLNEQVSLCSQKTRICFSILRSDKREPNFQSTDELVVQTFELRRKKIQRGAKPVTTITVTDIDYSIFLNKELVHT